MLNKHNPGFRLKPKKEPPFFGKSDDPLLKNDSIDSMSLTNNPMDDIDQFGFKPLNEQELSVFKEMLSAPNTFANLLT